MKTLKKALSIILGVAIMLSCLFGMQVSVAAEGNTLALSVGEATVADGVVTVPVIVDSNTGFQTLAVTVGYDNTVLTLTGAAKNAEFATAKAPGNDVPAEVGEISTDFKTIQWAYVAEAVTATGTIATFTFAVVEGATAESTDITLTVTEAWDGVNDFTATATAGTVDLVKECAHEWGDWVITQPTKTETGLKVRTCTVCNEATEEVVIEVPVLDETYTFAYSMNIQDSLGVSYNLKKANITNPKYVSLEFVSTAKKYNTDRNIESTPEAPLTRTDTASYYVAAYTGIAMYELDLPISTYIKYYDAEGIFIAYSATVTKSPLELMKEKFASSSDKSKRLTSDMLNLGAAAQTYFGNRAAGSDLSKATLVNSDPTYLTHATTGEISGLTVIKDFKWADDSALDESAFKATLNYAGTPTLGFTITKDPAVPAEDFELSVSYNAVIPTAFAGERKVEVGANGDAAWSTVTSGKYLSYAFSKITLADSNQTVTAALKYQGKVVCTLDITMEAVISEKLSGTGDSLVLSQALARFGASARNYFAK